MSTNKLLLFLVLILFAAGCAPAKYANIKNLHTASGKTIVCLGDSLTAGVGAPAEADYPSLLAKGLPFPVINAGIAGDTAASALSRLENDVLSNDPRIVVVELGANDYLSSAGSSKAMDEAFKNLESIIDKIQEYGAVAVVAGVSINYGIEYKYRKLAEEKGAALVPDIMGEIANDHNLMADDFHPNAEGYKVMAKKIIKVLIPLIIEMR